MIHLPYKSKYPMLLSHITSHPLAYILLLALFFRGIAVLFSAGYGMHDDHFLIIEIPWSFLSEGRSWFADAQKESKLYMTLHYGLLVFFKEVGITAPETIMLVIRFLHALYSLSVVTFGFRIAEILGGKQSAINVGIVLACFWLMPFMSVRNLVEMVCIPPLMAGWYMVLKMQHSPLRWIQYAILAGLLFGLTFSFRYQTALIPAGVALVLLWQKQWRCSTLFVFCCGFGAFLAQGILDIRIHGYAFADFVEYARYNATHGHDYTTGPWYQYLLLLFGTLIPPASLLLLWGFGAMWRKAALFVIPILIFIGFHSYFPNKQERFILPVVPALLIVAVVGYKTIVRETVLVQQFLRVLRGIEYWFWGINVILLLLFSVHYSKKSRVETMLYLGRQHNVRGVIAGGGTFGSPDPPMFYAGRQLLWYDYSAQIPGDVQRIGAQIRNVPADKKPNYAVLFGSTDLPERKAALQTVLGATLVENVVIQPGLLDALLYRLNPAGNINETVYIYSIHRHS